MECIEFMNRIWVEKQGTKLQVFVKILAGIYCVLQTVVFMMEGIDLRSALMILCAIFIFVRYTFFMKHQGYYMECFCRLQFSKEKLVWEYPSMKIKGKEVHMTYCFPEHEISTVEVSFPLKSARVTGRPTLTMEGWKKECQAIDFAKKKKDCRLVLYHDKIEAVHQLFCKYFPDKVEVMEEQEENERAGG